MTISNKKCDPLLKKYDFISIFGDFFEDYDFALSGDDFSSFSANSEKMRYDDCYFWYDVFRKNGDFFIFLVEKSVFFGDADSQAY